MPISGEVFDLDLMPLLYPGFRRMLFDIYREVVGYRPNIWVASAIRITEKLEKEVRIVFGFPGCGCPIVEVAVFPMRFEDDDALKDMLGRAELVMSSRPWCPKCGAGAGGQERQAT